MEKLDGRVAVIMEGGGAAGHGIARRLARAGATVVLVDADAGAADKAAAEIRHGWGTAAVHILAKADAQGARKAVADIRRTCGGIDILVLQQGDIPGEDALIDAALPLMEARGHGVLALADTKGTANKDLAAIEERLSACRQRVDRHQGHTVLTYAVAPLEPGAGDLGGAIAYLAATRPSSELAGRLIVVPPD
jgi:NAD(P)-dependent dehydrogenase (short-subunit alcohol dehydrogenase family)